MAYKKWDGKARVWARDKAIRKTMLEAAIRDNA